MKPAKDCWIVLVTAPDMRIARRLARVALGEKLIACANLLPRIESHYRWKGKLEKGGEVLMILKTTSRSLPALEKTVIAHHPYDTPEFVVLPVKAAAEKYLAWWNEK